MIIPMVSVMTEVTHAVQQLAATGCSYADFVSVLRDTRESYQITQAEMAKLLNVAQGTISKFESMAMGANLDFFISYAYALGLHIDIDSECSDVVSNSQKRQHQIIKELSAMEPRSIESIYMNLHKAKCDGKLNTPIFSVTRRKKSIIKKMLAAKTKSIMTG